MMEPGQEPKRAYPVAAGVSRTGRAHTDNEDAWWAPGAEWPAPERLATKGYLYVVADGIGGHAAGDVASRAALETLTQTYYQDPDPDVAAALERAILAANGQVYQLAQQPAYQGMGSTVVAAVVHGQELLVAHAGDSRAYLLREGTLQPLTRDHTWVAEKVAEGLLTSQEATNHPQRNIITRSLGDQPSVAFELSRHDFLPDDRLLLCTDGVTGVLAETEVAQALGQRGPRRAARALIGRVDALQGADDATAVVVTWSTLQTGLWSQVPETLAEIMASPRQRLALLGAGAVLLVALFACVATLLPSGGRGGAELSLDVQRTQSAAAASTAAAIASPSKPAADTAPPTDVPAPTALPTDAPDPTPMPPPDVLCGAGDCSCKAKLNRDKPLYQKPRDDDAGRCNNIAAGTQVGVLAPAGQAAGFRWSEIRVGRDDLNCPGAAASDYFSCDADTCKGYMPDFAFDCIGGQ